MTKITDAKLLCRQNKPLIISFVLENLKARYCFCFSSFNRQLESAQLHNLKAISVPIFCGACTKDTRCQSKVPELNSYDVKGSVTDPHHFDKPDP